MSIEIRIEADTPEEYTRLIKALAQGVSQFTVAPQDSRDVEISRSTHIEAAVPSQVTPATAPEPVAPRATRTRTTKAVEPTPVVEEYRLADPEPVVEAEDDTPVETAAPTATLDDLKATMLKALQSSPNNGPKLAALLQAEASAKDLTSIDPALYGKVLAAMKAAFEQ